MKGASLKIRKIIIPLIMALALLMPSIACLAEGGAVIMEVCTNESDLSVYVKNAGISSDVTVLIGTNQEAAAVCETIADTPFETLILIDNSLSIPQNMHGVTVGLLDALFKAKAPNEKMAVGVFDSEIKNRSEFTDDYDAFKAAADAIQYQNQQTYITDMICKLWEDEYRGSSRDVYRRILIIADGVDDESIGYTKDEWNRLIAEDTYPIYTVGYKAQNNNAQLENLFALSRQSNAEAFLLNSADDIPAAVDAMSKDKDIVKVVVTPPANMRDGNIKSVKINFADQSISKDIRMPQQGLAEESSAVETSEEESSVEETEEEVTEESETEEEETDEQRNAMIKKLITIAIMALAMIITILLIVLAVLRIKKKRQDEENYANDLRRQRENELKEALPATGGIMAVVLTDMNTPGKCFRATLEEPAVVGHNRQQCKIVIDYNGYISGKHCVIYEKGGQAMIKDLASTNGTFMNGVRIISEMPLQNGASIVLGQLQFKVEITRS